MIALLIKLYRANPYRPHCNAAEGHHVWLCRILLQQETCKMIGVEFANGSKWCPAKDN